MGIALVSQIQLMAALERRTQPCDAGYGGIDGDPWNA